jgi:hypothetical protein
MKAFVDEFTSTFNYEYFSFLINMGYPSDCRNIPSISGYDVNPSDFTKFIAVMKKVSVRFLVSFESLCLNSVS